MHWSAPVSTLGSLVAGFVFILAHHLFYQSLNGTLVSDDAPFGFEISQQQVNVAVGTAFAFLAKACLVVAVSAAFVQIFWHTIRAQRMEAAPTLERIDAVYSTLDNAFEMLNVRSWYTHPVLMVVAGLAWLIPIASVLTPATLSVGNAKVSGLPTQITRVANVDFANMNYLAQMPNSQLASLGSYQGPAPYYYAYAGPSKDLLTISNAVLGDGAILPISPPGLNASWSVEFNGPSLECKRLPKTETLHLASAMTRYLRSVSAGQYREYGYIAWYPSGHARGLTFPYGANCTKPGSCSNPSDDGLLNLGVLAPAPDVATLNRTSRPLEILVMVKSFADSWKYKPKEDSVLELMSCHLYNTSYNVAFDYTGGTQKIKAATSRDPTASPIEGIPGVLYKYMNQSTDYYEYPCNTTGAEKLRCCYTNPRLFHTLTYQAIMDAFTQKFQGVVYIDSPGMNLETGEDEGASFHLNTTLMQTKLAQSSDLGYLRSAMQSEPAHTGLLTFQAVLQANNETVLTEPEYVGVDSFAYNATGTVDLGINMSLSDTIEEVFRNFTISLMSSEALQPNYSSPTAPSPATVTFLRYHNVYSYSAHNLWLAYGIAFGLAAVAVAAGLITIFINQASYSSNFSTVLRAAHGAQLSSKLSDDDVDGQDPLPKHLGKARVLLRSSKSGRGLPKTSSEGLRHRDGEGKTAISSVRLLGQEWPGDGRDDSRPSSR